jgi:hypothetical protein
MTNHPTNDPTKEIFIKKVVINARTIVARISFKANPNILLA